MASRNVAEEIDLALAYGRPIIPLVYRRTAIDPALNDRLRRYQFLDFRRGGYASNLLDVIAALAGHGVTLDVDRSALERRRDEHLGAPIDVEWTVVFQRVPKWAFAWGIGWTLFFAVLTVAGIIWSNTDEPQTWLMLPPAGLIGGFVGGLTAGLITMISLRHNAGSIRWRHMSPTIRIWSLLGPIGVAAAIAIVVVAFGPAEPTECTGDPGQCFSESLGEAIGRTILAVIAAMLYILIAVFTIGSAAGWLTVSHIRRLEPGIRQRQAAGAIVGWGCGAIVAAISAVIAVGLISTVLTGGRT